MRQQEFLEPAACLQYKSHAQFHDKSLVMAFACAALLLMYMPML